MRRLLSALILVLMVSGAAMSFAAGLPPWEFGMSKAEVKSFSEFGPYRAFPNGDIETFTGIYDGKKENIQFFFDGKGLLRRIGVYLYEGQDTEAARMAWKRAYESLEKIYGKIEIPDIKLKPSSEQANSEVLSLTAVTHTDVIGKTQMAPVDQPKDTFVFSSFFRRNLQGVRYFWVVIYFDPRP